MKRASLLDHFAADNPLGQQRKLTCLSPQHRVSSDLKKLEDLSSLMPSRFPRGKVISI